MSEKNKYIIIIVAVIVLILIGIGAYVYLFSSEQETATKELPAPEFSNEIRSFEIISSQEDNQYKAKDLNSGKEVTLIIPQNANFLEGTSETIKNGSKIEAEKTLEASNGILITQLKVY